MACTCASGIGGSCSMPVGTTVGTSSLDTNSLRSQCSIIAERRRLTMRPIAAANSDQCVKMRAAWFAQTCSRATVGAEEVMSTLASAQAELDYTQTQTESIIHDVPYQTRLECAPVFASAWEACGCRSRWNRRCRGLRHAAASETTARKRDRKKDGVSLIIVAELDPVMISSACVRTTTSSMSSSA